MSSGSGTSKSGSSVGQPCCYNLPGAVVWDVHSAGCQVVTNLVGEFSYESIWICNNCTGGTRLTLICCPDSDESLICQVSPDNFKILASLTDPACVSAPHSVEMTVNSCDPVDIDFCYQPNTPYCCGGIDICGTITEQ